MMRRLAPYLMLGLIALAAAAFSSGLFSGKPGTGGNLPNSSVVGNTALAKMAGPAAIVHRVGFHAQGDAPELAYIFQSGSCAGNNMANDGGACVDANDGNSWKAIFPTGRIDIRQFGARPDNATPADTAVAAANAYSARIGACTYVPAIYPGFRFNSAITLTGSGTNCLKGDRVEDQPIAPVAPALPDYPLLRLGKFSMLHFPNDTDGVVVNANQGFDVENLSILGNAAQSQVATHTHGLHLDNSDHGHIANIWIQNFVVCAQLTAGTSTIEPRDIYCRDKWQYPNIVNDYPYAGVEMDSGHGSGDAVAALQWHGGEIGAAAGDTDQVYNGDGTIKHFQICPPGVNAVASGTTLTCSGTPQYVPLWAADGIKVWIGNQTVQANGQGWDGPAGGLAGYKVCGVDYTIWDVSASGGGGAGGTQLYCGQMSATLTSGSAIVAVGSTAGIQPGNNILAWADHGIPSAAKVDRIVDATHLALTKPAYASATVTLNLTQIAIATVGPKGSPAYSQACQSINRCGYKIEVRFASAPPAGSRNVNLQWVDPTGYTAFDAEAVSDYLLLQPTYAGGYRTLLKHVGLSDGGIEFRPTYIEIANQCIEVNAATSGDVIDLHRVINDPIPNCPGYVDPKAGPTIVSYNNSNLFLNGAKSGYGGENLVLNGGMSLDQANEGNLITAGGKTLDGWGVLATSPAPPAGGYRFSLARATNSPAPPAGIAAAQAVTITGSQAGTGASENGALQYTFDGDRWADTGFGALQAQTLSLGFQLYASQSGTYGWSLQNAAGTRSFVGTCRLYSANSWTQCWATIPGDTGGSWLLSGNAAAARLSFAFVAGANFQVVPGLWQNASYLTTPEQTQLSRNAGAKFAVTGVTLAVGSSLPYVGRHAALELALAQRRYEKSYDPGVKPGQPGNISGAVEAVAANASGYILLNFRTPCAKSPIVTIYSPNTGAMGKVHDVTASADVTASVTRAGTTNALAAFSAIAGHQYAAHYTKDCRL